MAQTADSFGRVDDDGTVHVLDGDAWRPVGSFPDGTPEEALAYFRRKFDDLAATLTLAEQRIKAKANAKDIRTQLAKMGKDLLEPAAVGDLAGLRAKVEALLEKLPDLAKEQDAEAEVVVTEAIAHREGIVTQM
ncbi:MAG TPA: DUF349 domain-containing protein, partial [Microbacteriaceae bacterium]|nr:DUF349 domain-containing protein [Microbacteriaceae bacterium]